MQRYDRSLSRQFDCALVRLRELQRDRAPKTQPLQPDTTNLQNEPKPAHEIRAVLPIDDARRLLAALGYHLNPES